MKKFIQNILKFTIPLVLILIGPVIYLYFSAKSDLTNYKINKDINRLIVGDSHAKLGISDSIITNSLNIAQFSESYLYTYFILDEILKTNKNIDTLLLSCSYHNFAKYYDNSTYHPEVIGRYFYIIPDDIKLELVDKSQNMISTLKFSTYNFIENLFSSQKSFIGKFEDFPVDKEISEKYINKRISKQYGNVDSNNLYSDLNISYFDKIKDLCKNSNVELILIRTPLHQDYFKKIPKFIIDKYQEITKNRKIIFLDDEINNRDIMPDGDHLSDVGAIKFSKYINEEIKKN